MLTRFEYILPQVLWEAVNGWASSLSHHIWENKAQTDYHYMESLHLWTKINQMTLDEELLRKHESDRAIANKNLTQFF